MSQIVDRVAKAMLVNDEYDFDRLEHYSDPDAIRAEYWSNARAAIAAMREPTAEMIEAGRDGSISESFARGIWDLMIGAALAEKDTGE